MNKFVIVVCCVARLSLGAPSPQTVVGFGDATPQEIAEIRAGTYGEMFDENPQYTFNYKVADNDEQTYMSQEENRDGDVVTGSYSYVDPYGSLITVTYQAGAMGYTETREVQENFVQIRDRPQSSFSSSSASSSGSGFSSGSGSSFSSGSSNFGSSSSSNFGSGSSSNFGSSSSGFGSSSGFSSGSSSGSSQQSSSSLSQSDIVSSIVSQISPLVSQTVNTAVSGASRRPASSSSSSLSNTQSSLSSSTSSQSGSNDVVNQVVSQIAPLVSQTVSSVVAGSGNARQSSAGRRVIGRVRVPAVPRVVATPSPVILAPAPRIVPVPAPRAPVAAPVRSSSSNLGDLFGDGNFNVRINTPDFNIEY